MHNFSFLAKFQNFEMSLVSISRLFFTPLIICVHITTPALQFLGVLAGDSNAFNHVYRTLWLLFEHGEVAWRPHLLDMFEVPYSSR
jgi:hypothetical protein